MSATTCVTMFSVLITGVSSPERVPSVIGGLRAIFVDHSEVALTRALRILPLWVYCGLPTDVASRVASTLEALGARVAITASERREYSDIVSPPPRLPDRLFSASTESEVGAPLLPTRLPGTTARQDTMYARVKPGIKERVFSR